MYRTQSVLMYRTGSVQMFRTRSVPRKTGLVRCKLEERCKPEVHRR